MPRKGKPRLYGLFEKNDHGKYVRLFPDMAYTKPTAVRVFQGALLDNPFRRCLRPVGHVEDKYNVG